MKSIIYIIEECNDGIIYGWYIICCAKRIPFKHQLLIIPNLNQFHSVGFFFLCLLCFLVCVLCIIFPLIFHDNNFIIIANHNSFQACAHRTSYNWNVFGAQFVYFIPILFNGLLISKLMWKDFGWWIIF